MATPAVCKIEGCDKGGKLTRGWCAKHYLRWQRHGDPLKSIINRDQTGRPCAIEGCAKMAGHKGFCQAHYRRQKLYGDPEQFHPDYHNGADFLREHKDHTGTDCLGWPYSVNRSGRGMVQIDGVQMSAPRAMCMIAHGPPPTPSHEAAHSCGKGHEGCVNPHHLRWATPAENKADMVAHGTIVRGEQVNTAVLTESEVRTIRASREPTRALANRYGVSMYCIQDVRARRSWAWLD